MCALTRGEVGIPKSCPLCTLFPSGLLKSGKLCSIVHQSYMTTHLCTCKMGNSRVCALTGRGDPKSCPLCTLFPSGLLKSGKLCSIVHQSYMTTHLCTCKMGNSRVCALTGRGDPKSCPLCTLFPSGLLKSGKLCSIAHQSCMTTHLYTSKWGIVPCVH